MAETIKQYPPHHPYVENLFSVVQGRMDLQHALDVISHAKDCDSCRKIIRAAVMQRIKETKDRSPILSSRIDNFAKELMRVLGEVID